MPQCLDVINWIGKHGSASAQPVAAAAADLASESASVGVSVTHSDHVKLCVCPCCMVPDNDSTASESSLQFFVHSILRCPIPTPNPRGYEVLTPSTIQH